MELLERMFAASSASAQLEGDRATTAIWELEIFGGRPSGKATGLQLQSGNSRFFGGRPSGKATGLQLQSENSWFLPWWLVVRRQGYNDKYRGLVTVDFTLLDFSAANPVTTAVWELEFFFGGRPSWKATGLQLQSGNSRFLGAGPVGRRRGYNCNLGIRDFWGQAQLEGDRARTAIWELEIFWWQDLLQSRFFGWQSQLENDRATTAI